MTNFPNSYEKVVVEPDKNNLKHRISEIFFNCGIPDLLIVRFVAVYFFVSTITLLIGIKKGITAVDSWQTFINTFSFSKLMIATLTGFLILTLVCFFTKRRTSSIECLLSVLSVFLFSLTSLWRYNNFYYAISVIVLFIIYLNYVIGKKNFKLNLNLPSKIIPITIFAIAGMVTVFLILTSIYHHKVYCTYGYDLGIFIQMFRSMVTDFSANTTCERDVLMSHFNVHASYIFYLLAPFFALFPHPYTLLIAQVLLITGGIIPLYLIARNHKFSNIVLIAVCFLYIFCSGLIAPNYFDFHENAFLPTLLMWTLYAIDKKKIVLLYIMSILVCIVKEDAPIYIICIGLFFLIEEKSNKRYHGLVITAMAAIYFIIINSWLMQNGDGEMMTSSRFANLTFDNNISFFYIIKNSLVNPSYLITQLLCDRTLIFFLQIMLPLMFLPFMSKKIHRLILIIPFILMNLIIGSGYEFASNINFQYILGPSCLLIYLSLINIEKFNTNIKKRFALFAMFASIFTAMSINSDKIYFYNAYKEKQEIYEDIESCLDTVPTDASAIADTRYVPHLSMRDEIYILKNNDLVINEGKTVYKNISSYDFVVLKPDEAISETILEEIEDYGYTIYNEFDGHVIIYVSPDYIAK